MIANCESFLSHHRVSISSWKLSIYHFDFDFTSARTTLPPNPKTQSYTNINTIIILLL